MEMITLDMTKMLKKSHKYHTYLFIDLGINDPKNTSERFDNYEIIFIILILGFMYDENISLNKYKCGTGNQV